MTQEQEIIRAKLGQPPQASIEEPHRAGNRAGGRCDGGRTASLGPSAGLGNAEAAGPVDLARRGARRVVLVGDRGMITQARLREDLIPAGLDWFTALRAPAIQALATADGRLQLSLFDERDLAEITAPEFPGERLVVCKNQEPALGRGTGPQA